MHAWAAFDWQVGLHSGWGTTTTAMTITTTSGSFILTALLSAARPKMKWTWFYLKENNLIENLYNSRVGTSEHIWHSPHIFPLAVLSHLKGVGRFHTNFSFTLCSCAVKTVAPLAARFVTIDTLSCSVQTWYKNLLDAKSYFFCTSMVSLLWNKPMVFYDDITTVWFFLVMVLCHRNNHDSNPIFEAPSWVWEHLLLCTWYLLSRKGKKKICKVPQVRSNMNFVLWIEHTFFCGQNFISPEFSSPCISVMQICLQFQHNERTRCFVNSQNKNKNSI